ncbi:hypothetical protein GOBAR_AA04951 [Gossypium barbadense]|uniref:Uncharacterized protein n=1 Tax=Gossypium barbadense TaxID=3634 RepID=A0A2P5YJ91_GOSBA|nr:hypothetical protein GOBAR_AA04951 [Gossypium barbadense]
MEMPLAPPNKSTKAKVKKTDEPTQLERRLGCDVHYNVRLLESIKIGMAMFVRIQKRESIEWPEWSSDSSKGNEDATEQQEEENEEIDDKAKEDDDFASYY